MPYRRVGKSVYKHGKRVGSSKSITGAKKYLRTLRAIEHGWRPKKRR